MIPSSSQKPELDEIRAYSSFLFRSSMLIGMLNDKSATKKRIRNQVMSSNVYAISMMKNDVYSNRRSQS